MSVNGRGDHVTRQLSEGLRALRHAAGLTTRQLADLIDASSANISNWERGERLPKEEVVARILDQLGATDEERDRLTGLRRQATGPGRLVAGSATVGAQLAELISQEQRACRITEVNPMVIPGLLQTAGYARAILDGLPDVDTRTALRLGRREVVTRARNPVEFHALIDSEVLVRPIAPAEDMAEQLRYLKTMAEKPNVHLRVMSAAKLQRYSPMWAGSFILLEFPTAAPIVHLEHYRSSAVLWEPEDVSSFAFAADEIVRTSMTEEESVSIISEIIDGMETP